MITIYHANNSLDAHLIKNLLIQQDIQAYMLGEHLQSGVGEIPAIGLVRVSVSDADYMEAKKIVDAWDTSEIIEEPTFDSSYVLA
jgi:hypothetical protein